MKILDYKSKTFFQDLLQATSQAASGIDTGKIAADVIAQVRQNGDAAVAELTEKFGSGDALSCLLGDTMLRFITAKKLF